ncbi:MAG: hypothetical protein MK108_15925 [Mariniblastus sp.]|nr:hypothetical protein [Mariniblastus sp.]
MLKSSPSPSSPPTDRPRSTARKRKKKFSSLATQWIRRIHLYSGLFMLPWVLLYGFTALLFNHPTISIDPQTEIRNFVLPSSSGESIPLADDIAALAVASAQQELEESETGETFTLAQPANAVFTRKAFGTFEDDQASFSLVMDLNTASGYLRTRHKTAEPAKEPNAQPSLAEGLEVQIAMDPLQGFTDSVSEIVTGEEFDLERFSVRSFPTVEFDAVIDGQPQRVRYTRVVSRRSPTENTETETDAQQEPVYQGRLTIVGNQPRDLPLRSYLLRLHMAHGYPVQKNHRWFWAIAVDMMFASMVFWGLSGVVMWWQIKRTRRIGFFILVASALVAIWLAIGMHWQLVHG